MTMKTREAISVAEARMRLVLTVPEAASLLHASRSWVYSAAERGEIPCRRMRGRIFILARELLKEMGDDELRAVLLA